MARAETVSVDRLQARLRQFSAVYRADKMKPGAKSHIYYSGPLRQWLKVARHPKNPQFAVIEYHAVCPCSLS